MSAGKPVAAGPADFDALSLGRLTWLGLAVAALGWALMIGEAAVADVARVARTPTLHGDLVAIAACMIGSGFALAVVGALQSGFGTLNRFFEAVLSRSAQRAASPVPPAPPVVGSAAATPRRPYRTLPDGSVEVETILGTRRFETMREAADFI